MSYPAASDSLASGTAAHGNQEENSRLSHAWAPLLPHLVWAQCLWRQLWQQLVRTKGCSGKQHLLFSSATLADVKTLSLFYIHTSGCASLAFICVVICLKVVLDTCLRWAVLYVFILRTDRHCPPSLGSSQQYLNDSWTTFWNRFIWLRVQSVTLLVHSRPASCSPWLLTQW